jgi:hypothetical protein
MDKRPTIGVLIAGASISLILALLRSSCGPAASTSSPAHRSTPMNIDPSRVSFVENDTSNETLIEELSGGYKPAKTWTLYIDGVCTGWYLATHEPPFRPGRPYSFIYENTEPDFETLSEAETALANAYVETNSVPALPVAGDSPVSGSESSENNGANNGAASAADGAGFGLTPQRSESGPAFGMHVVVEFNTSPGLAGTQPIRRVVGPFKIWETADEWVEKHKPASYTVLPLGSPDDER